MSAFVPLNTRQFIKGISLCALILFRFVVHAQINCENTSTGLIPLVDLTGGTYEGYAGGLYPDNSNSIPVVHLDSGIARANRFMPLNWNGDVDTVYGKVGLLALGNVNAQKSFNRFYSDFSDAGYFDSCVRLINGCLDAYDLRDMINPAIDSYWKDVFDEIQAEGLKKKQIQAVWVMAPSFDDTVTSTTAYIDSIASAYVQLARAIKTELPNVQLLFISGMPYGGYVDTLSFHAGAVSEPANYLMDFAIKEAISAQINGDTLLQCYGDSAVAPWMCWGPNLWADGETLRAYDNLRWICPDDFDAEEDGSILVGSGLSKISSRLFDYFTTSPLTTPWIFGLPYDCFTEVDTSSESIDTAVIPEGEVLWIVTNPVRGAIKFSIDLETNDKAQVYVFDIEGREITEGVFNKIEPGRVFSIRLDTQAHGLYVLSVFVENRVYNKVFYLDN